MNHRKFSSCKNGYNYLICTACRYMFGDMCLDLNHHDSTIEHYLKELDTHDIVINGYKRLFKFIDKGIID